MDLARAAQRNPAGGDAPPPRRPTTDEVIRILRTVGPFRDLPAARLAPLAEQSALVRFPVGGQLVGQGEVADSLYVVARGRVRVEQSHPHLTDPLVLAELGPGEVIGEMGVLSGRPCSATVIAVEPTDTLRLAVGVFPQVMRQVPEVAEILVRILSLRLRRTEERVYAQVAGPPSAETDPIPDTTEEGLCRVDLSGQVLEVDLAASRLTGYRTAELLGRDLHALLHPAHICTVEDCRLRADLQRHAASDERGSQQPDNREREVRAETFWRRDGTRLPVHYVIALEYEADEAVSVALVFRPDPLADNASFPQPSHADAPTPARSGTPRTGGRR